MRLWDCRHTTLPRHPPTPCAATPGFLSFRWQAWNRTPGTFRFEPRHWKGVPGRNDVDVTHSALRHPLHDLGDPSLHASRCAMCCTMEERVAMLCQWLLRGASLSRQVSAALLATTTHSAAFAAHPVVCNQANRTWLVRRITAPRCDRAIRCMKRVFVTDRNRRTQTHRAVPRLLRPGSLSPA
jgi:hypothetical protein